VPATLNGDYALVSVAQRLGTYRIDDVVATTGGGRPGGRPPL